MIRLQEKQSLRSLNTFGVDVKAKLFTTVSSVDDVATFFKMPISQQMPLLILGSGSNILFVKDFDGIVVKDEIKGIDVVKESSETVTLRVAAGEEWHEFVRYCVDRDYGGVENLSLIPGTVGAAPIQNIGAYGVELMEVIDEVSAVDRLSADTRVFKRQDCRFGYRESVFKHELREKLFISSVTLTLTKKNHRLNTSYGAIHDTLKQMNVTSPTIRSISDAVIAIRQSKLPDPSKLGNAGSFFKNPVVGEKEYTTLKQSFPAIPGYFSENQSVKVPAAWLIEQCGWKGKRNGDVGVHHQQALVIVNYGNGTGESIYALAMEVKSSVQSKFGISLTPEVNIV